MLPAACVLAAGWMRAGRRPAQPCWRRSLAALWLGRMFVRRLGGYTGDCLGAVQQLAEALVYVAVLATLGHGAWTRRHDSCYLVRHPQPDVAPGLCYGASDVPVAGRRARARARGADGARAAGRPARLASPLQRCARLAERLAAAPRALDARLAEMDFGAWELRRWDAIPRAEVDAWAADLLHYRPGGAENVLDVARRVRRLPGRSRARTALRGAGHLPRRHHPPADAPCGGVPLEQAALQAAQTPHRIGYGEVVMLKADNLRGNPRIMSAFWCSRPCPRPQLNGKHEACLNQRPTCAAPATVSKCRARSIARGNRPHIPLCSSHGKVGRSLLASPDTGQKVEARACAGALLFNPAHGDVGRLSMTRITLMTLSVSAAGGRAALARASPSPASASIRRHADTDRPTPSSSPPPARRNAPTTSSPTPSSSTRDEIARAGAGSVADVLRRQRGIEIVAQRRRRHHHHRLPARRQQPTRSSCWSTACASAPPPPAPPAGTRSRCRRSTTSKSSTAR